MIYSIRKSLFASEHSLSNFSLKCKQKYIYKTVYCHHILRWKPLVPDVVAQWRVDISDQGVLNQWEESPGFRIALKDFVYFDRSKFCEPSDVSIHDHMKVNNTCTLFWVFGHLRKNWKVSIFRKNVLELNLK